jgi:acyl-CoA synthetase (AMP-forming)/AMP-acid ligase II
MTTPLNSNSSTLIHQFLENSAKRFPDKIALIHDDERYTYAQINAAANQVAGYLLDQGIAPGDRVVMVLKNSFEYVCSYYGVLKAGGVVVPLSSDLKPDSLTYLLKELEPAAIISSSRFEKLLKTAEISSTKANSLLLLNPKLEWDTPGLEVDSWEDMILGQQYPDINIPVEESSLASIIYTSGSTGEPKGVMLSHRNIVSNTHAICSYLELTDKDIQMVVLPFHYVMGKSLLNTHFAVGGSVVINNQFAYPATVVKQMMDENVTGFSGVPSTYAYLLHRSPLEKHRESFESLRYCTQAGGHMPQTVKKRLREILPGHTQIFIMYGATEAAARLTYLEPKRFHDKMDSIGKPIPGVSLSVLDDGGQEIDADEIGELVADGPNVMQGYWRDEKFTAGALNGNGYHTGDLGFRDKEGYFFITGRKDDLLKVGGHRINPQEIEDALMASELLFEAAVLGLSDDMMGTKLVALTAPLSRDCTENEIMKYCAEKLPKYKIPAEVKIVRMLPKNEMGKIDRAKCLELIS